MSLPAVRGGCDYSAMTYRGLVAGIAMLSACAQASRSSEPPDAPPGSGDARPDAPASVDGPPIDGPPACTPMNVNLLQNPSFDATPLATMWTETRYANELIVRNDGFAAHTGASKAWLGGVTGSAATDALHQDIAIPASATGIAITGYYHVITGETGTTVFDRGSIDLVTTAGALIEPIAAFDNAHATTGWTPFNKTFAQAIAGTTVRLRMTSTNDILNETSFYFDTLALTATVCP